MKDNHSRLKEMVKLLQCYFFQRNMKISITWIYRSPLQVNKLDDIACIAVVTLFMLAGRIVCISFYIDQ